MSNLIKHTIHDPEPLGSELACILGLNIERLRKRSKINKTIFSLMLGIGRPTLNKLERGTANPRLELIERIAAALEVEVLELLAPPFEDVDRSFYQKSRRKLYSEDL